MKHTIINRSKRILTVRVGDFAEKLTPNQSVSFEVEAPTVDLQIEPVDWGARAPVHGIREIRAGKTFDLLGLRGFVGSLALFLTLESKEDCVLRIENKMFRHLRGLSCFYCTFDCFVVETSRPDCVQARGYYLSDLAAVSAFCAAYRPVFLRNAVSLALFALGFSFFCFLGIFHASLYYYLSGICAILLADEVRKGIKWKRFKRKLTSDGYVDIDELQQHSMILSAPQ